jgi:hypothetical protein
MHAVTRPRNRINTVSIKNPSANRSRYFRVNPSLEYVSRATGNSGITASAASRARNAFGKFSISSQLVAPRRCTCDHSRAPCNGL